MIQSWCCCWKYFTRVKEIIMEKLIELLNEYWEYDLVEHNWEICKWDTNDEWEINIYTDYTNNIISKKYWFIKWLVDNDKIDRWKISLKELWFLEFKEYENVYEYDTNMLLMLLSIQDSPVEFLCEILR